MTQSATIATLVVLALLASGCGSKEDALCSNGNALDARQVEARAAAKTEYSAPVVSACLELDPPLDGQAASVGLTNDEYGALLRRANGNFFDDHTWWLKATPRGASHVVPVQITAERCEDVSFTKFGYGYASATPPLPAAPPCGRYLTGLEIGHRVADSWPLIFSIEGSGLIRLAPLSLASAFAASLRAPRNPLDAPTQGSTIDRLDVVRHDGDSLELVALANGSTFASALRLVLTPGETSRLSVELELDPRALAAVSPLIAVAGLSGWFSDSEGHDLDRVRATFADGTSVETVLSDPGLDWGDGGWTPVPLAQGSSGLESLAFLQNGTQQNNVTLSNLQSNVRIEVDLSVSTQAAPGGNVVANLLVDSSAASAAGTPIWVSYLLTASP